MTANTTPVDRRTGSSYIFDQMPPGHAGLLSPREAMSIRWHRRPGASEARRKMALSDLAPLVSDGPNGTRPAVSRQTSERPPSSRLKSGAAPPGDG